MYAKRGEFGWVRKQLNNYTWQCGVLMKVLELEVESHLCLLEVSLGRVTSTSKGLLQA